MYQNGRKKLTILPVFYYTATLAMVLAWMSLATPAQATEQKEITKIERFVQDMADDAIKKLTDKEASNQKRKKMMRKILNTSFSVKTIARFALGQFWRSATKEQKDEYLSLFEGMIITTYADRFKEYSGQKLQVTGITNVNRYDTMVHSQIVPDNAKKSNDNIRVDWRVRNRKGKTLIIDIIVEGISMSVTQRSDFESVIQKGGGDIESLLASMRIQMEKNKDS